MVKHIMYGSIYQIIILLVVAFGGHTFLPEPNALRWFEYAKKAGPKTMYPGFKMSWDRETDMFRKWKKKHIIFKSDAIKHSPNGIDLDNYNAIMKGIVASNPKDALCAGLDFIRFPGGYSSHLTFFFNLFVLMQIANMIASRKIHDECNIFAGICENWVFVFVWALILILQVVIIEYSGFVFSVIGLSWEQWVIAFCCSLTIWLIDLVIKTIPDRLTYAVGKDTVYDEREVKAGRQAE